MVSLSIGGTQKRLDGNRPENPTARNTASLWLTPTRKKSQENKRGEAHVPSARTDCCWAARGLGHAALVERSVPTAKSKSTLNNRPPEEQHKVTLPFPRELHVCKINLLLTATRATTITPPTASMHPAPIRKSLYLPPRVPTAPQARISSL